MPRPGRRALSALLLAGASIAAPLVTSAPASAAPVQIQLLTINDFHGRLQPDANTGVPGVTKLATLVETVSTQAPTSFASAGDNIGASPFVSAVAQDQPTIDVLNAMGLDVSAVGNHEFDKGFADLRDRVIPASDFPFLGANVRYAEGEPDAGERALDASTVVDVGGVDVGYVGVVTGETESLVSPDGITMLDFTDPVAEAEDVAAELKDGNPSNGEADVVVVLAHEGAASENIDSIAELQADPVFGDFVAMSDDVDAIFSGHTHQAYAFDVPVPGASPARSRPVVSTGEYGKRLGRVKLTVDTATGSIATDVVELLDPTSSAEDPEVKAIVDAAVTESAQLGSVQIGEIDADILRSPDRNTESDLANFIADAQLAFTAAADRGDADLALMNPGGIRADLKYAAVEGRPGDGPGVVTYSEAFDVQSFANSIVTQTFTGAQVYGALEQQWQPPTASRPFLALGISEGLTFTYNPAAPKGYRINPGSVMLDGTPIDLAGEYRVTTNSFLAAGGDNFTVLGQGTDDFTLGETDLAALRSYLESFDGPAEVDREPRTAVAVPEEPDLTPFDAVADAVTQQFTDIAGRAPTAEEQEAWEVGIYTGTRTIEQMILELQVVELRDPAAQVTRIYLGLFGRGPSAADLDYWVAQMAAGRSINSVASFFARSSEFVELYGDTTDEEFVELVYENVLGRAASADDLEYWLGELDRGVPRYRMFLLFSEAPEYRNATAPHLKVIDLYLSMLDRTPTGAELTEIADGLATGELTITDLITDLLHSEEYATRVNPPPPTP
jgi:2',3'-cyclic-nucleotide 2'-phosphodiesterase (5'-nucleotidase family)